MRSSLLRCELAALLLLAFSMCAFAREPISFSIHDAPPVIVQGSRPKPAFSIHDREETVPTKSDHIAFSVYDAKPMPSDEVAKPDCSPARQVNRVLVIYHAKPIAESVRVKVCDQFGCRFENRVVQHSPKDSDRVIAELKKLSPKWSLGDKECDHFKPVNADDPDNKELLKELDIKRSDLPLLVKEGDPERRKKAAGMSGEEIAKLWNKWFIKPKAEETSVTAAVEQCLPQFGFDAHQWTYPGNIRHHLTDPRFPHHLPKALVDSWSDAQCVGWHNWHHQMMSNPQRAAGGQRPATKRTSQASSALETRIATVAQSLVRRPPPKMVAATSSADSKSKKKRTEPFGSGSPMNGSGFAKKSLAVSSRNSRSLCSILSRC